jgi:MSHA biogenesis protein MshI
VTQYINLYDESLRPSREVLTLTNVALAVLATLLLLMGLAAFGMARSDNEMRSFKVAEAKLMQSQEQLTVLAVQHASRQQEPALEHELAQLRAQLAAKTNVLARLKEGEFGDRQGFNAFFLGLANGVVDEVWITGFDVSAGGHAMTIRGRMLTESRLPRYVEALSRQPAFARREFSALNVSRVDAKPADANSAGLPAYVAFELRSGSVAPAAAEVAR